MTILLLNSTPIVHKLVEKLALKRGDVLLDAPSDDARPADVVIVDDSVRDTYDAGRAKKLGDYTLFIGSRFDEMPQGFDADLPKPFLPDELSGLLDDAQMVLASRVDRSDLFDADEAEAAMAEVDSAYESEGVFADREIDEVKQLLDAFDSEMMGDDVPAISIEKMDADISEAMETVDESEWERPFEEVLFEAAQEQRKPVEAPPHQDAPLSGAQLHARGVEALQDLMAILSDESVARALKAMGVRIDISFGEKA